MGLGNIPGWSYSAERAWYDVPDYEDEPKPEREMTVREVIKIMNERNKNRMKLYEISEEYAAFIEAFDNGEIPDEAFDDTFDSLHGMFEEKCVAVACSIKNDKALIDALKAEKTAMEKRIASLESTVTSKSGYLMRNMERAGVTRLTEDPRARISIKKNSNTRTVFANAADFLKSAIENGWTNYLTTPKPELNKTAVKRDLENGVLLPGVYLERGKRVEIS